VVQGSGLGTWARRSGFPTHQGPSDLEDACKKRIPGFCGNLTISFKSFRPSKKTLGCFVCGQFLGKRALFRTRRFPFLGPSRQFTCRSCGRIRLMRNFGTLVLPNRCALVASFANGPMPAAAAVSLPVFRNGQGWPEQNVSAFVGRLRHQASKCVLFQSRPFVPNPIYSQKHGAGRFRSGETLVSHPRQKPRFSWGGEMRRPAGQGAAILRGIMRLLLVSSPRAPNAVPVGSVRAGNFYGSGGPANSYALQADPSAARPAPG